MWIKWICMIDAVADDPGCTKFVFVVIRVIFSEIFVFHQVSTNNYYGLITGNILA